MYENANHKRSEFELRLRKPNRNRNRIATSKTTFDRRPRGGDSAERTAAAFARRGVYIRSAWPRLHEWRAAADLLVTTASVAMTTTTATMWTVCLVAVAVVGTSVDAAEAETDNISYPSAALIAPTLRNTSKVTAARALVLALSRAHRAARLVS